VLNHYPNSHAPLQMNQRALPNSLKTLSKIPTIDGWEVEVIQSLEEIEAIRPVWEAMQRENSSGLPNSKADLEEYLFLLRSIKQMAEPYIIVLRLHGYPKAMLIARKGMIKIGCRIGYLTLLKPSLRAILIHYGGIVGQLEPEACSMLMEELNRSLRNNEADVVFFNHLPVDSHIYQLTASKVSLFCRDHFHILEPHWKVFLPNSYDEFISCRSKNTRHNIRRYSARLVSKYGNRLSIKCFNEISQVDQIFKDTVEVAEKTYQHALGSAFVDDINTRNLIDFFITRKRLIAYLLYIDGKPCAFWHGIRHGKTFFTWMTGYDPTYRNDRIGQFLLVRIFETLCGDQNFDAIDFGFGDAQYKESFCDTCWTEASLYIFAPRFRPMLVNSLYFLLTGVSLGMSSLVRKTGFEGWVKRRWRNFLQRSNFKKGKI
jgi:hypothetical protein